MKLYRFGRPRYAPHSVRVPFESEDVSGILTFTAHADGQLSEPLFNSTPLSRSALGLAARAWAEQHQSELLAMIAESSYEGFSAEAGVVVYRVERAGEFGLVSFWTVSDYDPGWIGTLTPETLRDAISRFHHLPLERRQRLLDVARAQLESVDAEVDSLAGE